MKPGYGKVPEDILAWQHQPVPLIAFAETSSDKQGEGLFVFVLLITQVLRQLRFTLNKCGRWPKSPACNGDQGAASSGLELGSLCLEIIFTV